MAAVVTESQKRTVACPKCGRAAGRPCRKIGTGGAIARDLERAHGERRGAYLEQAPKCPGVDDAALASRAADLRASVGGKLLPEERRADPCPACGGLRAHAPGCSRIGKPLDLMGELRKALTGEGHFAATITPVTELHPRPVHYMRRWSGVRADESPICGADPYADRTLIGETHDVADNPMPICAKCAEIAKAGA